MEFDKTKNFVYMEDNGDGTITQTLNFPEYGINDVRAVMNGSLMDTVLAGAEGLNHETFDEITENTTVIPDSVD